MRALALLLLSLLLAGCGQSNNTFAPASEAMGDKDARRPEKQFAEKAKAKDEAAGRADAGEKQGLKVCIFSCRLAEIDYK